MATIDHAEDVGNTVEGCSPLSKAMAARGPDAWPTTSGRTSSGWIHETYVDAVRQVRRHATVEGR